MIDRQQQKALTDSGQRLWIIIGIRGLPGWPSFTIIYITYIKHVVHRNNFVVLSKTNTKTAEVVSFWWLQATVWGLTVSDFVLAWRGCRNMFLGVAWKAMSRGCSRVLSKHVPANQPCMIWCGLVLISQVVLDGYDFSYIILGGQLSSMISHSFLKRCVISWTLQDVFHHTWSVSGKIQIHICFWYLPCSLCIWMHVYDFDISVYCLSDL